MGLCANPFDAEEAHPFLNDIAMGMRNLLGTKEGETISARLRRHSGPRTVDGALDEMARHGLLQLHQEHARAQRLAGCFDNAVSAASTQGAMRVGKLHEQRDMTVAAFLRAKKGYLTFALSTLLPARRPAPSGGGGGGLN